MQFRYIGKISLRDLRKKSTIAILILISVSALFINAIYANVYVYSVSDEYFDKQQWPTEIVIHGLDSLSNKKNLTKIAGDIKKINGVKWIVTHGDGILILNAIAYGGKNFTIIVKWCNVEDPTFPNPKFLVEGNFFRNNNEDAVILETFGKQLLEDIKIPVVVGSNGTKLEICGVSLSIVGIVGNPLNMGNEEGYIRRLTNVINIYVPLLTYYRLVNTFNKSPHFLQSVYYKASSNIYKLEGFYLPPGNSIYVKVKEGYSVDSVADKIRNTYPDLEVYTYTDYRKWYIQYELSNIPRVIGIFMFISLVMIWEIRYRKKEIATLKTLGWSFRDITFFYTIRNIWLSIIASFLSSIFIIFLAWLEVLSINWYQINLYLSRVPPITPVVTAGTLLFSMPSLYFVYRASIEEAIRA